MKGYKLIEYAGRLYAINKKIDHAAHTEYNGGDFNDYLVNDFYDSGVWINTIVSRLPVILRNRMENE